MYRHEVEWNIQRCACRLRYPRPASVAHACRAIRPRSQTDDPSGSWRNRSAKASGPRRDPMKFVSTFSFSFDAIEPVCSTHGKRSSTFSECSHLGRQSDACPSAIVLQSIGEAIMQTRSSSLPELPVVGAQPIAAPVRGARRLEPELEPIFGRLHRDFAAVCNHLALI